MTIKAKQITRNTFWALVSRTIEMAATIIVVPMAARYLGVEDYGMYSFIMAITWMLSPFLILGLPRILARDIAQEKDKATELVSSSLSLIVLLALSILIVVFATFFLSHTPMKNTNAILLSVAGIIFLMCSRIFISVFIAFEQMRFSAGIAVTSSASLLIFTGGAVYFDLGFISLFVAFFASNLLGLVGAVFLSLKYFSVIPQLNLQFKNLKYILKESYPIFVSQVLMQAQQFVGVFMLKTMGSYYDIGIFQAPLRVLSRLQMLPIAFMVGLLPLFARLSAHSESNVELRNTVLSVCKLLLIVSLPLSIFGFIFSERITLIMFGDKFLKASSVLKILIFSINLTFLLTVFELYYISVKKQKNMIIINAIGVLATMVLCLVFIPRYGYIGASIAYMISAVVVFLATFIFLKDIVSINDFMTTVSRPLLGALLMGVCLRYLSELNLLLLLLTGGGIYLSSLFILRPFSLKEVQFIKNVVGMRKPI